MKLAILHSLPLSIAALDSVTVSWLIGGLVVALILMIAGVLVTAPARRHAPVALAKPEESLAAVSSAAAPMAAPPVAVAPSDTAPAPVAPAVIPPEPVFDPGASQPAIPIPVGPDFSASGPIMLPSSVVAASFSSPSNPSPVTTGPLMPPPTDMPAPSATTSPSVSGSGPLIAPAAQELVAPAVPFVVTPVAAPSPAPASANHGTARVERVPLPDAVDLFAHSYGRSNAAMLSATERAAAARIARALSDDPLAVQLAGMYAAGARRSPDSLAQLLEADRRNRFQRNGEHHAVSDADALDMFAGSYGRTNAAMLSATERAAAARIVHALGDDPLAVRLAGMYAADTHRPLDGLANQLETDLRHTAGHNSHHR